jgi:pimeloyl-ACP methyl ester carboxylesterase
VRVFRAKGNGYPMSRAAVVNLGNGFAGRIAPGDGNAVFWIHGYTLDSGCWTELWQGLPGWRHIGVDLPGHGSSLPLRCDEELSGLARKVGALAMEHNARHLVAASFGSVIAMQIALEYPEAFATLSLGGPLLGGGPFEPDIWSRYDELAALSSEGEYGAKLCDRWMDAGSSLFRGLHARPQLRDRVRHQVCHHPWWELADRSYSRLWHTPQHLKDLRRIQSATLILVGAEDCGAVKQSAYLLERTIPGSRRRDLERVGHLCLLEEPECVDRIVEQHWRAHSTSPELVEEAY